LATLEERIDQLLESEARSSRRRVIHAGSEDWLGELDLGAIPRGPVRALSPDWMEGGGA